MLHAGHLLLGFSCFLSIVCEDPQSEGLSSTSLLDAVSLSNLESADSSERGGDGYPDTDFQQALINTPQGSGFSSQETEEISIFQSPKYFWDDEARKSNGSSEDNSRPQTDGPDTSSIHDVTHEETTDSGSPKERAETSTMLWSTDMEETSRLTSPSTKVPEEEETIQTTAPSERMAPLPHTEEMTVSNMAATSTVYPMTRPSRKNRKHSGSKNHHVNHNPEPDSRAGPPADSRGLPAGPPADSQGLPAGPPADSRGLPAGPQADSQGLPAGPPADSRGLPAGPPADSRGLPAGPPADSQGLPAGPPADSRGLPAGPPADSRGLPAGPPADSQGLPAGHSPAGPDSPSTQSLHIESEEGKIRFSTQRDVYLTKAAVPSEVSTASHQVVCKDWSNLTGKNYVILNMSDDIDCEKFRWQKGQHLLSLLEGTLAWKTDTPQRDWVIFLSKPNKNDNHLLMTIRDEERGVLPVKDVFKALGDIKRSLAEIGIESYSSIVSCQSRPSPPRSDYGKLFIVLVIIGSICVMIIIAGLIYICWQRRLPKLKNMELHFVENGCHDNPTLDVAMDNQSEMQEKKASINGGTAHRPDGWETLINKTSKDETDTMEEDTHL